MGEIVRDVRIRLITDEEQTTTALSNIARVIEEKTEPALRVIKANLITLKDRFERAGEAVVEAGEGVEATTTKVKKQAPIALGTQNIWSNIRSTMFEAGNTMSKFGFQLFRFGRTLGFTGFVLNVTFRRINDMIMGTVSSILKFIQGIGTTDSALGFLESTLTSLAMAGLLGTEVAAADVVDEFKRMWKASVAFQGQLSRLMLRLQPFLTILIDVAAEGLEAIADEVEGMKKEDLVTILTNWKEAAVILKDSIVDLAKYIIEKGPELSGHLKKIAEFLGGFAEGWVKGKIEDIITGLNLLSASAYILGIDIKDMGVNLGDFSVHMEDLGTALTAIGSPLQTVGNALWFVGLGLTVIAGINLTTMTTGITALALGFGKLALALGALWGLYEIYKWVTEGKGWPTSLTIGGIPIWTAPKTTTVPPTTGGGGAGRWGGAEIGPELLQKWEQELEKMKAEPEQVTQDITINSTINIDKWIGSSDQLNQLSDYVDRLMADKMLRAGYIPRR